MTSKNDDLNHVLTFKRFGMHWGAGALGRGGQSGGQAVRRVVGESGARGVGGSGGRSGGRTIGRKVWL